MKNGFKVIGFSRHQSRGVVQSSMGGMVKAFADCFYATAITDVDIIGEVVNNTHHDL